MHFDSHRSFSRMTVCQDIRFVRKWKFGLVQCLLHRAYTISSSWLTFSQEVDFLKGVFSQNGYPEDLFTSCLRRFVNNKCDKSIQNSKIKEDRIKTIFFIPYIGLPSIIFSRTSRASFKELITYLKLDDIYRTKNGDKLCYTYANKSNSIQSRIDYILGSAYINGIVKKCYT